LQDASILETGSFAVKLSVKIRLRPSGDLWGRYLNAECNRRKR